MSNIKIGDIDLHYEVTGNGSDVVLLHGWGSSLQVFRHIAQQLEKNFRVYAIDFPGFGTSAEPPAVWGVNDYTVFLETFIRTMNISNPTLVAHSFGGRVALLYASRNEVNKLTLIDSAGIKPRRRLTYYFKIYSFKLSKKLLPVFAGRKRASRLIEQRRKKSGSSDYNAASGVMRSVLVKTVNEDLRHVMPAIKAPTLLIWGDNDTATPLADAKIMKRRIADCGLVVLKGAGHFSFLDKAAEFNIIIDAYLNNDKQNKI
jgi:pimeloyl-ACP methyl ester carboxylesterase